MAIIYANETITTKAGEKVKVVSATNFDYKKDAADFYDDGFRYFNAKYNKTAGRKAVATFGLSFDKLPLLKKKNPKRYAEIDKQLGLTKKSNAKKSNAKKSNAKSPAKKSNAKAEKPFAGLSAEELYDLCAAAGLI